MTLFEQFAKNMETIGKAKLEEGRGQLLLARALHDQIIRCIARCQEILLRLYFKF
jgi:hypothetical protein